jgi:hypothetical protein
MGPDIVAGQVRPTLEYDVRRPLTTTGTNLLGMVKHPTLRKARYFGAIFDRTYPEPMAFVPRNEYGVLDHEVTLPSGESVHNPMRVIADEGRAKWCSPFADNWA